MHSCWVSHTELSSASRSISSRLQKAARSAQPYGHASKYAARPASSCASVCSARSGAGTSGASTLARLFGESEMPSILHPRRCEVEKLSRNAMYRSFEMPRLRSSALSSAGANSSAFFARSRRGAEPAASASRNVRVPSLMSMTHGAAHPAVTSSRTTISVEPAKLVPGCGGWPASASSSSSRGAVARCSGTKERSSASAISCS
mmetsp:Transcript_3140/g.9757  ORF Transcript_3140/g.9757 Transcript_3140/m.9757 type:complete len:204 (+) Transcript_3140:500-1111(+)